MRRRSRLSKGRTIARRPGFNVASRSSSHDHRSSSSPHVDTRHDTAWPNHAEELGNRGFGIGEEEQSEGAERRVERRVGEHQMLGVHHPDIAVQTIVTQRLARDRHHARGEIDANHATPLAHPACRRQEGGAATTCHVEDRGPVAYISEVDEALAEEVVVGIADSVVGRCGPVEHARQPALGVVTANIVGHVATLGSAVSRTSGRKPCRTTEASRPIGQQSGHSIAAVADAIALRPGEILPTVLALRHMVDDRRQSAHFEP